MTEFATHCKYAKYSSGEWITKQNTPADNFYITLAGTMDVFIEVHDHHSLSDHPRTVDKRINRIVAGQPFGEVGLLRNDKSRSSSILCTSVVEVAMIDAQKHY
jgi:CRP-like cAMP-binding protein